MSNGVAKTEKSVQEAFSPVSSAFPEYQGREEVLKVIWQSVAKGTTIPEFIELTRHSYGSDVIQELEKRYLEEAS